MTSDEPTPELNIETQPDPHDLAFVENRLIEYNYAATGRDDGVDLAIFIRNDAGEITAGITGYTWAGWLEVQFLWVHDGLRGQGIGKRLLLAAEAEAVRRGCKRALLDSHDFQAPDFYKKLGYEVFGVLPDFPEGYSHYFLTKKLG